MINHAVPAAWGEPNRSARTRLLFVTTSCHLSPATGSAYGGTVCTVILGWGLWPTTPIALAANRDELLARPTDPPLLLTERPPRWGGRDRLAGGTWLAVDPVGRVAAVTNRHPGGQPPRRDSTRRSRGGLPLDALGGDDAAARAWASGLQAPQYNPVNLLYASPTDAWCASMDDGIGRRLTPLGPGVHVLTEQEVDDPSDAKTEAIRAAAQAVAATATSAHELIDGWRGVLKTHDAAYAGTPACIHGELHGTVSSASVLVETSSSPRPGDSGTYRVSYEHAEGPPCQNPYLPVLSG